MPIPDSIPNTNHLYEGSALDRIGVGPEFANSTARDVASAAAKSKPTANTTAPVMKKNPYSFKEQTQKLLEQKQAMARHARMHERGGIDPARLSVQDDGVNMPLELTINFITT
jgi:hypothetical protein